MSLHQVEPILDVLVNKTLEQSMMEVEEEYELERPFARGDCCLLSSDLLRLVFSDSVSSHNRSG